MRRPLKPFHWRQGILVPDNCLSCELSLPWTGSKTGAWVLCIHRRRKPTADGKYPFGEYDPVEVGWCGAYQIIGGETLDEITLSRAWYLAEMQHEIRELRFEEERWRSGSHVKRLLRYIQVHTRKIGDIKFGRDAGDVKELQDAISWCKAHIKRPLTEAKRCACEVKLLEKTLYQMEARVI